MSTLDPEWGVNTRVVDSCKVLAAIREYAMANDIRVVFFLGDLFEARGRVHVPTLNHVHNQLRSFFAEGLRLYMLPGNHDQATRTGEDHSLSVFGEIVEEVLDEPGWTKIQDQGDTLHVLSSPYQDDAEELLSLLQLPKPAPDAPAICLLHHGVDGARYGDLEFTVKNPLQPKDLLKHEAGFAFTALGHFHYHQQIGVKVFYVGATHQHNWGDVGQPRGFVVADTETGEWEHVPLHVAPEFLKIKWGGPGKKLPIPYKAVDGHFVKMLVPHGTDEAKIQYYRSKLEKAGARWVLFEEYGEPKRDDSRLNLDPSQTLESLGAEYISNELQPHDGADPVVLMAMYREHLQKARERLAERG